MLVSLGALVISLRALAQESFLGRPVPAPGSDVVETKQALRATAAAAAPGYDGDSGLFHVPTAQPLPKGQWTIAALRDNLDRDPKDIDVSIHAISFVYGLTNQLQVFGQIGLQNRVNTDARGQEGFVSEYPLAGTTADYPSWQTGFGDVKLGVKYVLRAAPEARLDLAIRAYTKLPTADVDTGLGTGRPSGGLSVLVSKGLGRRADLIGAIGYVLNGNPQGLRIGNTIDWGVGARFLASTWLLLQAELSGKVYTSADFEQTNPADLTVGPVFWVNSRVFIRPALSWNLRFDDRGLGSSSASYTGRHISIGYRCCEPERQGAPAGLPAPPPPPANRPPTVAVDCRSQVVQGGTVPCRAAASDLDGDPLTYAWSSDAGRVFDAGADAMFTTTEARCGAQATITVVVSDGRGETASGTKIVEVFCPPSASVQAGTQFQLEQPSILLEVLAPGQLPATAPDYCRSPDAFLDRLRASTAGVQGGTCTLERVLETRLGPPPARNSLVLYCRLRPGRTCLYTYRAFIWAETTGAAYGYRVLRQGWIFRNCNGELTELEPGTDSYDMPELDSVAVAWRDLLARCAAQ